MVVRDHVLEVYASAESPVRISLGTGSALYYKSDPSVSTTSYDGTLAAGANTLVEQPTWIVSAGRSIITVSEFRAVDGDTALVRSTTNAANANVPADIIVAGTPVFQVKDTGRVQFGENDFLSASDTVGSTMHNSAPDFVYDPGTLRPYTRSMALCEVGDSTEIQMRRAGPDNSYPGPANGTLTGLLSGTTIGQISWYPFCTPNAGTPGTTATNGVQNPSGAIYMSCAQDPYAGKTGGTMKFATTPVDTGAYVTRLVIGANGHIYNGGSDLGAFVVVGQGGDEASKVGVFRGADTQSANIFEVQYGASHHNALFVGASSNVSINSDSESAQLRVCNHSSGQAITEFYDSGGNKKLALTEAGALNVTNGIGINGKTAPAQSADTAAQSTTTSTQTTPWGFASQAQADAIATHLNDIRTCLRNHGLMA